MLATRNYVGFVSVIDPTGAITARGGYGPLVCTTCLSRRHGFIALLSETVCRVERRDACLLAGSLIINCTCQTDHKQQTDKTSKLRTQETNHASADED